ncbi:ArfGap-domain-containing protein [Clavulina sp. PMI_390]|nr:ArfGap-domain-containing protein [Clavulina sp. PMI_390]
MDPAVKQQLNELINRPELGNKVCADCNAQNPQWCSLSFANFICLTCAGIHRGFGVHVSFVRSVSMDSFSDEQLRRMKLGGNAPFQEFLQSYENGGYSPELSIHDKYHCWAASQYRDKLTAELEGRPWAPSASPTTAASRTSTPDLSNSAQSLRKARTSTRTSTPDRTNSAALVEGLSEDPMAQKASNEAFFESLGATNAARPDHLPPSQGGRYGGFGSTPTPPPSSHPSFSLSSGAAPTLADLQADPMAALGKGWSLFSSAVAGATRTVNSTVIQPTVERVSDPTFRAGVTQYVSDGAKSANSWGKTQLGVDVGSMVQGFTSGTGANSSRGQYSSINHANDFHGYDDEEGTSALYSDAGDDDFFHEFGKGELKPAATQPKPSTAVPVSAKPKKDEWDDGEWKDF